MALLPVDGRQVAAVVTYLEMTRRPKHTPLLTSPLQLMRWNEPKLENYRILFRLVGEPWLWFSRLVLSDEALSAVIQDQRVEIYVICDPKGIDVGLLELDFRETGQCNIAFLGIVPPLTGQGLGQWLIEQALTLGWRKDVRKMTVQTCTLDDPRALPLYLKAGFRAVRRAIETFDDPRPLGLLSTNAAPHIPIL